MRRVGFFHVFPFFHLSSSATDANCNILWKIRHIFDMLNDVCLNKLAVHRIIGLFKEGIVFKQCILKK